jgi:hypothetical protein
MMDTKRKLESERGSVLILTALCMVVLLGFVGLALDTGYLYHERRLAQTAADAGAMAGASEIRREREDLINASALAGTADNGFADGVDGVVVNVHHPPITGYYIGNDDYVEVTVAQPRDTFFMSLFGWGSVDIPARGVAGYSSDDQICIYALEPDDPDGFWYNSSAQITAECGLHVNSCDDAALHETSNAVVTVGSASMCGDYWLESSSVLDLPGDEEPQTGAAPATDPLSDVPEPEPPMSCSTSPQGGTSWTFGSGTWTHSGGGTICGGIRITNDVVLNLSDGIYYIMGGTIDAESSSVLNGENVMFYLTEGLGYSYQPMSIESSSELNLSAPGGGVLPVIAGGVYDGILFFQDRDLPSSYDTFEHRFQSSDYDIVHDLEGALYFPDQVVRFESSTHIELVATGSEGAIIARRIIGDSNSVVNVTADPDSPSSALQRLTLVE